MILPPSQLCRAVEIRFWRNSQRIPFFREPPHNHHNHRTHHHNHQLIIITIIISIIIIMIVMFCLLSLNDCYVLLRQRSNRLQPRAAVCRPEPGNLPLSCEHRHRHHRCHHHHYSLLSSSSSSSSSLSSLLSSSSSLF